MRHIPGLVCPEPGPEPTLREHLHPGYYLHSLRCSQSMDRTPKHNRGTTYQRSAQEGNSSSEHIGSSVSHGPKHATPYVHPAALCGTEGTSRLGCQGRGYRVRFWIHSRGTRIARCGFAPEKVSRNSVYPGLRSSMVQLERRRFWDQVVGLRFWALRTVGFGALWGPECNRRQNQVDRDPKTNLYPKTKTMRKCMHRAGITSTCLEASGLRAFERHETFLCLKPDTN